MADPIVTTDLTLTTDQSDYAPGSTATFTVTGANAGDTIDFVVMDDAGNPVSGTGLTWTVAADDSGIATTTWAVGQDAANEAFTVQVVDETTQQTAAAAFTDSPPPTPVDFTGGLGQQHTAGDAILTNTNLALNTGTGNLRSFLTIQNTPTESGFNTDGSPLPLDDKRPQFTNAVELSQMGLVHEDGSTYVAGDTGPAYRMFVLDVDESAKTSPISLDALQVWQADSGSLTTFDPNGAGLGADSHKVYSLDDGGDKVVLLDGSFTSGSGNGADLAVLIPNSDFNGQQFVYLYSSFSGSDAGPEEWAFVRAPATDTGGATTAASPAIEKDVVIDLFGPGNVDAGNPQTFDANTSVTGTGLENAPVVLAGHHVTLEVTISNFGDPTTGADITGGNVTDNPNTINFNFGSNFTLANGGHSSQTVDIDTTNLSGLQSDTATFTGTYTDSTGAHAVNVSDPANFFVATAGISVDKQFTSNNQAYIETGAGHPGDAPVVLVGSAISYKAVVANQTTGGLGVTGLQIADTPALTFTGNASTLGAQGALDGSDTTSATASDVALAGLHTDTVTATGTVTDAFGYSTPVMASDEVAYYGATAGVNVEKLVSVDGGLNWYTVADANDNHALDVNGHDTTLGLISAASGISIDHLHYGTALTFTGQSVLFEAVVTDTSTTNNSLTETVTVSDSLYTAFTFGGNSSTGALSDGQSIVSDVLHVTADGGNTIETFTNLAGATGTVTDSFGNVANPTDSDSASYSAAKAALPGLSSGFWTQHLTDWDGIKGNDSKAANLENAGTLTKAYLPATDDVNPLLNGVLLGDVDHSGTTNGGEKTLFVSLLAAQEIIGQSGGGNADVIMMNQLIAAQLNDYNDGGATGGHAPAGLIEAGVSWLTSSYTAGSLSGGNVDTNHDALLETQSITAKGAVTIGSASVSGLTATTIEQLYVGEGVSGIGFASGTTVLSINGTTSITLNHNSTANNSNDSLTFTPQGSTEYNTSTKAFAATLATSSLAWTASSQVFDETANSYTAIDGHQYTVTATGEGLKNALQAYDQGQLVISADGSLVGWNNGSTVTDVHVNTAGAFWGILEDQNLQHAGTIVGVNHT